MTLISNLTSLNHYIANKKFKNEKDFTSWFLRHVRDRGGFAFKISDYDIWLKPCDAIIARQGVWCLVEFKYIKHGSCYPFRLLRGSSPKNPWYQVKWLETRAKNGWISLVIVYSEKKHCFKVLDFKELSFTTREKFDEK